MTRADNRRLQSKTRNEIVKEKQTCTTQRRLEHKAWENSRWTVQIMMQDKYCSGADYMKHLKNKKSDKEWVRSDFNKPFILCGVQ